MEETLAYLQPHEMAALDAWVGRLMVHLDGQLIAVYLFGSKARGDFTPDSDIDVLIVLKNVDGRVRGEIRLLGSRVSLEYDVLINTHILSRARWEEMARQQATLWREVQRDGVALAGAQVAMPSIGGVEQTAQEETAMVEEGIRRRIEQYLARARQALRTGRLVLEHKDYITAVNRAYYAIFYAANALLATKGLERSKHSGVIAAFRQYFVKTGVIETEYGDFYGRTMDDRHEGDYDVESALDYERARRDLEWAERFVERIERALSKVG